MRCPGNTIYLRGQFLQLTGQTLTELEIKIVGNLPTIKWRKGQAQGVNLYSNRGTEDSFAFLALDTASPYHDSRPNLDPNKPEVRQYYALYVIEDEEMGQRSDINSLTVGV